MTTAERMRASFPPLDPNGQPFSMMLRGSAAELNDLRSLLQDKSLRKLLMESGSMGGVAEGDADGTVIETDESRKAKQFDHEAFSGTEVNNSASKRMRDDTDDVDEECCSEDSITEDLLLFLPSIQCNCSSWDMVNVCGDLVVTSIRILFVASSDYNLDAAIDSRCIALHAVDSESTVGEESESLPHVYCQLSDPGTETSDIGYSTAFGIGTSNIKDENDDECNNEREENQEEMSDDNGVVELYFKPMAGRGNKEVHDEACQRLFEALTKLASLVSIEDDDGYGGGLFNMLSLMAGMGGGLEGVVHDDDDMVIRLGGSNNNLVEDDNSEGAPLDERQAMLNRLDNLLVVPPELEILSEDEGQFDDAADDELL